MSQNSCLFTFVHIFKLFIHYFRIFKAFYTVFSAKQCQTQMERKWKSVNSKKHHKNIETNRHLSLSSLTSRELLRKIAHDYVRVVKLKEQVLLKARLHAFHQNAAKVFDKESKDSHPFDLLNDPSGIFKDKSPILVYIAGRTVCDGMQRNIDEILEMLPPDYDATELLMMKCHVWNMQASVLG